MLDKYFTTAITLFVIFISIEAQAATPYDPQGATWLSQCGVQSDADIRTAHDGGIICCSKTWGYCVYCPKGQKCFRSPESEASKKLPRRSTLKTPPVSVMQNELKSRRQIQSIPKSLKQ